MADKEISGLTSELLEKGQEKISEGLEASEQLYNDAVKATTKLIRKHPIEAMAVTFGIGCLVGLVLTSRR